VPHAQALCNHPGERCAGCKHGWKWRAQHVLTHRRVISKWAEMTEGKVNSQLVSAMKAPDRRESKLLCPLR